MNIRKMKKQIYAVSPVIATLMLVLVSVGSAGAFYVWQTNWQGDVEGQAGGTDNLATSKTIDNGGSSTVYVFSACSVPAFENDFEGWTVNFQSGGSGAGVMAVGTGVVDLGSASRFMKASEHADYPDYDGDGSKDDKGCIGQVVVAWDAVVVVSGTGVDLTGDTIGGYTATEINAISLRELVNNSDSTNQFWDRSSAGGTEEVFVEKLLKLDYGEVEDAVDAGELGRKADGGFIDNQELLDHIQSNPTHWGFMSWGMASGASNIVVYPYNGTGDSTEIEATATTIGDSSYDGSRPITYLWYDVDCDGKWDDQPKIKTYIDYCLEPNNNQIFSDCAGYISIYDL